MKNRTLILLYLLLLVLIVFFEYRKTDATLKKSPRHHYEIENNKNLDTFLLSYIEPIENNISLNKLWKIVPKKVTVKEEDNNSKKVKLVEVSLKKKTLCIKKECFMLLGIFEKERQKYASFYNKERKERVEVFLVGDVLDASIKIKTIEQNTIVFHDVNSTREWSIHLFDVNSSKYKPKEFEE